MYLHCRFPIPVTLTFSDKKMEHSATQRSKEWINKVISTLPTTEMRNKTNYCISHMRVLLAFYPNDK